MKIHTTQLMGFHGHLLGTLQVLFFAPCLRPHRAEDKVQIKAQLGGLPVRGADEELLNWNKKTKEVKEITPEALVELVTPKVELFTPEEKEVQPEPSIIQTLTKEKKVQPIIKEKKVQPITKEKKVSLTGKACNKPTNIPM